VEIHPGRFRSDEARMRALARTARTLRDLEAAIRSEPGAGQIPPQDRSRAVGRAVHANRAVTFWLGSRAGRGFTARDSQLPGYRRPAFGRPGLADTLNVRSAVVCVRCRADTAFVALLTLGPAHPARRGSCGGECHFDRQSLL